MSHSIYSPSSAHRWSECPGSIELIKKCPPQASSPQAEDGTNAHALADLCFLTNKPASDWVTESHDLKFKVTPTMAKHVQGYVNYVQGLASDWLLRLIETKVSLPQCPEVYGTADAIIYKGNELHVIDFKYGKWQVSAKDNPQLMIYTLGALYYMRERFDEWVDEVKVFNHIYQPRAAKVVQVEQVDLDRLRDFEAYVLESVQLSKRDDPPLVDGEWCRFCPAELVCPRLNSIGRVLT